MAEDMSREEQIAERWMRMKGIQKPKEPKPTKGSLLGKVTEAFRKPAEVSSESPTQLIGEAYDLSVEKQILQDDIVRKQREVMEPKSTAPALTLEQKRDLIRQGKIGAILQSISASEPFREVVAKSQARTREVEVRLDQIFSTPGMYEKFHNDLSRQVRVRHQAREVSSLEKFTEQADILALKLTREAEVQGRVLTSVERQFIEENKALKGDATERRQELLKDPEVFDRVRIMELQEYQGQLRKDRFAETPSRKRYLKRIEQAWAEAKKVLLTGETGTGKTEMIKHASVVLFGETPDIVRGNEDTNQYDIIGRVGLNVAVGDVRRPGSMIAAMSARDGRGKPVLIDEMDRIPTKQAMAPKELYNIRPGQKGVKPYPDGEGVVDVGPDYAVAATANIKSEKHTTATELDPAIVRVFDAPMDIDYIPAPEVYDLVLASLVDKRGGIPLSESDARIILKNLCDAASWIQDAYQGKQVVTDPASGTTLEARGQATTGKAASLKKALLDPGRTVDMLNGWSAAQVSRISFEAFLNQRIVDFINNRAYPDEDRYYLTEIFALKGFLRGKKANELMVSGLTQDTLDRWSGAGRQSETPLVPPQLSHLLESSLARKSAYLTADRVAKLDPYRRFKRPASADAEDLLAEEEGESAEEEPIGVITDRYKAVKDIVGDITSTDRPKEVHFAYLNKLEELCKRATSAAEKKQAIAMLNEYAINGAYATAIWDNVAAVDYRQSLRNQAVQKASELRLATIDRSTDFGVIKDFAGDLTTAESTKVLHHGYINRVFELGSYASSPAVMRKAAELLEEYGNTGVYQSAIWDNNKAVDYRQSLRSQAVEKAAELRTKMLSSI